MKSPITLAKLLQQEGITVSFWFFTYDYKKPEVEVNVHLKNTDIKSKRCMNPTQKEISEFLSTFLTEENEEN
jgi:hypothetical protein